MSTHYKSLYNTSSGFTLVELLVVISIISFLSSIVLSNISNARMLARDAQRISDIRQMRIALELYRNDTGDYPVNNNARSANAAAWATFQAQLAPYLSKLPVDPVNTDMAMGAAPFYTGYGYDYKYSYPSAFPGKYMLITQLENHSSPLICSVQSPIPFWCGPATVPSAVQWSAFLYEGNEGANN